MLGRVDQLFGGLEVAAHRGFGGGDAWVGTEASDLLDAEFGEFAVGGGADGSALIIDLAGDVEGLLDGMAEEGHHHFDDILVAVIVGIEEDDMPGLGAVGVGLLGWSRACACFGGRSGWRLDGAGVVAFLGIALGHRSRGWGGGRECWGCFVGRRVPAASAGDGNGEAGAGFHEPDIDEVVRPCGVGKDEEFPDDSAHWGVSPVLARGWLDASYILPAGEASQVCFFYRAIFGLWLYSPIGEALTCPNNF